MTRIFLLFAAALAGALTPRLAGACEPIGEPKPWYQPGLAQFVAIPSGTRPGATAVEARLVVGRNGTQMMPPGPIVLVPWSHGADCKPLAWSQTRDGTWSPPQNSPAFYTGRLRPRDAWLDGVPTVDIEMARLQPVWHGGEADRQRFAVTGTSLLLTPVEFFDFYAVIPTEQEFNERRGEALTRVKAWQASHPEMAVREPVRSMLRTLHDLWVPAQPPTTQSQRRGVTEIIAMEGRFVFADGASFFALRRDSTFFSGPLNLSGRVIEGTWREDSPGRFTIVGSWSWQNGISQLNDVRRMTLIVQCCLAPADTQRIYLLDPTSSVKVYRPYFAVDEIVK